MAVEPLTRRTARRRRQSVGVLGACLLAASSWLGEAAGAQTSKKTPARGGIRATDPAKAPESRQVVAPEPRARPRPAGPGRQTRRRAPGGRQPATAPQGASSPAAAPRAGRSKPAAGPQAGRSKPAGPKRAGAQTVAPDRQRSTTSFASPALTQKSAPVRSSRRNAKQPPVLSVDVPATSSPSSGGTPTTIAVDETTGGRRSGRPPRRAGRGSGDGDARRRRSGSSARPPSALPVLTAVPVAVVSPAPTATAQTAPASSPEPPERESDPSPDRPGDDAASVVTRTVTRIVEVVPAALRYALGVMAGVALLLAAALGLTALRARRAERRRRRAAADVGLLQSALLPVLGERVGPAHVSAAYRPAAGPAAGGDFYDAFALGPDRICVIVGDVAGHGREALPLTASVRYTVRAYMEMGLEPRSALGLAADVLAPQLDGRLVTAMVAVYDATTGRLTYASAGHPVPLLSAAAGPTHDPCASPPLGAGAPTGRRQVAVPLPPGATACFYTDGLLDVRCGDGRLGPDRLSEELAAVGARGTASDVISAVIARSDSQPDDMAAVMVRAPDNAARPAPGRVDELEIEAREISSPRPARFLERCGVDGRAAREALRSAAEVAEAAGTAVLRVETVKLRPEVSVRPAPSVGLTVLPRRTPARRLEPPAAQLTPAQTATPRTS